MPDEVVTRDDGSVVADVGLPTRVVIPPGGPRTPAQDPRDDGYPDVIADQRRGYAGLETDTPEEVAAHWDYVLAKLRPPVARREATRSVVPYVNHSRWVADCDCGGGMLCWDRNPVTCCLDCGASYFVAWAPPVERAAVVRALAIRDPRNRNWDPRRVDKAGEQVETVASLHRENVLMHGREQ